MATRMARPMDRQRRIDRLPLGEEGVLHAVTGSVLSPLALYTTRMISFRFRAFFAAIHDVLLACLAYLM